MNANSMDQYQIDALKTAALDSGDHRKAVLGLGLSGEAGEVSDLIKKEIGHRHEPNPTKIAYELGDVLWYLAILAHTYGYTLSEIATINLAKLAARYPEGFSSEDSINRAEDALYGNNA